jgi:hypothetical protein
MLQERGALMRLTDAMGVVAIGLVWAAPIGVLAQGQRPIAVPIVGSPAAQQPPQVPSTPPMPSQPPAPPQASPVASAPPQISRERKLELSFKDGTVALDAQNVTISEILLEWQRRDGCQFVNADKLPAAPMTIQFPAGTPGLDAIDSLLRGLGTPTTGYGYIVAPGSGQTAAVCGAVYIVPSSRPTSAAATYPPSFTPPVAPPRLTNGTPDEEIPPVVPFAPVVPPGQPQPYPGVVPPNQLRPSNPNVPGSANAPAAPASPGFGPIAPTAPGAGRFGAPPPTPAPNGNGRGGSS